MIVRDPRLKRTVWFLRVAVPAAALFAAFMTAWCVATRNEVFALINASLFGANVMLSYVEWTFFTLSKED